MQDDRQKYIKPIPKHIVKQIQNADRNYESPYVRFYAYFVKMKGELVKITVACKNYKKQWFCKQVAIHGVHSEYCLMRDMQSSIMGYTVGWYEQGLTDNPKFYEDSFWYTADDGYYDPSAKVVNKKFALKFDNFKYSAVDKYPYNDVFKYLRTYEQYPQAEYFIKIGLQHLATSKMLLKKAGKDKQFRRWLIQNARQLRNEYGDYPYFSAKVIFASYKQNLSILNGFTVEREKTVLMRDYNYSNTISKVIDKNEITSFLKYIKSHDVNISSYADYVKACTYIGLDMTVPKNRYPHDFKHWHDIRIDEYHTAKALKDEEERKELYAQFKDIANKYTSLEYDKKCGYIAIIAQKPSDLVYEGEKLNHCVGRMNYDQKFIREESLIFFIREKENPDTPFVTLEYSLSKKKVLQCYGENDHKPSEQVLEFVNHKWLPFANRQLRKIQTAA